MPLEPKRELPEAGASRVGGNAASRLTKENSRDHDAKSALNAASGKFSDGGICTDAVSFFFRCDGHVGAPDQEGRATMRAAYARDVRADYDDDPEQAYGWVRTLCHY